MIISLYVGSSTPDVTEKRNEAYYTHFMVRLIVVRFQETDVLHSFQENTQKH